MDLIRAIAFELEEFDFPFVGDQDSLDCGRDVDPHKLGEHLDLMNEAQLIESHRTSSMGIDPPGHHQIRLTWEGHEFVGMARRDGPWNKAKTVATYAGSCAFGIFRQVLTDLVTKQIEQSL